MAKGSNRDLGDAGESLAAAFLGEKQFNIIKQNFRFGKSGEIDIIARKGSLVVFAEVKSRESEKFGGALYSISGKKKRSLRTVAKAFLSTHPEYNRPEFTFRFDLLSVSGGSIDWIEDIFR